MVTKPKGKFLPHDYQLNLFRRLQNLRQKEPSVKDYMEEFYKLTIGSGYMQKNTKKIARYVNGLRLAIQDEISQMSSHSIEDTYQLALIAKKNLVRKQQQSSRGRGQNRGRGQRSNGRCQTLGRQERETGIFKQGTREGNYPPKRQEI
jgi:hypothetical protein